MKKIFNILLCLSMALITCFTFAGCNPKDTTDDDTNTPAVMNFDEYFCYNQSTAYSGSFDVMRISELSTPAFFSCNELETRVDTTFSHISFDITSESAESENLYVSIYTTIDGTLKTSCVSEQLTVSNTPTTVEFYFVQYQTGGKGFRTSIPSGGTETKTTLAKNTKFYIYYGTGTEFKDLNNNLYAVGEYPNAIGISNFTIK